MYEIPRRFLHYHVTHACRPSEPETDMTIDIPRGTVEVNLCVNPTANITRVRFAGETPPKARAGVMRWLRRA